MSSRTVMPRTRITARTRSMLAEEYSEATPVPAEALAAVGATMHKVLMLDFGVLKSRYPFDSKWTARQIQTA